MAWPACHSYIHTFGNSSGHLSVRLFSQSSVSASPALLDCSCSWNSFLSYRRRIGRAVYRSFVSETRCLRKKIFRFLRCAFQFILWAYPGICSFSQTFILLSVRLSVQPVSRQGLIAGGAVQSAGQPGLQSVISSREQSVDWISAGIAGYTNEPLCSRPPTW